jgi:tellurite resistance protein TehA-like permease
MPFEQPSARADRRSMAALAAGLPGGSFAFVMATGIVSIAAALLGHAGIATALLALNAAAFVALWALTGLRCLHDSASVLAEFCDHRKGPGFLTMVAGTNVLGDQVSLLTSQQHLAAALWLAGAALWALLVWGFVAAATTRAEKPSLANGIDGTWLLAVVATQSSAILGVQVAGLFPAPEHVVFVCLALFLLGGLLYLVIITLILHRWLFAPVTHADFTPSYWINMGAAAIATLAGARLVIAVGPFAMLAGMRGYILGETMFFWSVASWWIPLLAGLTAWRRLAGGIPLTYDFGYWAMVFPLGMYTAASFSFAQALGADFLLAVPRVFLWVAVAAWCVVFVGMLRDLLRRR